MKGDQHSGHRSSPRSSNSPALKPSQCAGTAQYMHFNRGGRLYLSAMCAKAINDATVLASIHSAYTTNAATHQSPAPVLLWSGPKRRRSPRPWMNSPAPLSGSNSCEQRSALSTLARTARSSAWCALCENRRE